MALRSEIVDLIGLKIVEKFYHLDGIRKVAVVQKQSDAIDMRILVRMIDSVCI